MRASFLENLVSEIYDAKENFLSGFYAIGSRVNRLIIMFWQGRSYHNNVRHKASTKLCVCMNIFQHEVFWFYPLIMNRNPYTPLASGGSLALIDS